MGGCAKMVALAGRGLAGWRVVGIFAMWAAVFGSHAGGIGWRPGTRRIGDGGLWCRHGVVVAGGALALAPDGLFAAVARDLGASHRGSHVGAGFGVGLVAGFGAHASAVVSLATGGNHNL